MRTGLSINLKKALSCVIAAPAHAILVAISGPAVSVVPSLDQLAEKRLHPALPLSLSAAKLSEVGRSAATRVPPIDRSEEHTYELQALMRISYAVFCLKKKKYRQIKKHTHYIS